MKINYQIMEHQKNGKYIPDYEALINNAACEEEKEYIHQVQKDKKRFAEHGFPEGFAYKTMRTTA